MSTGPFDYGTDVTFPGEIGDAPPEEACIDAKCWCRGSDRCPDCGRSVCTGEDCYPPGGEFDDRR